jgi:hypothetical protein
MKPSLGNYSLSVHRFRFGNVDPTFNPTVGEGQFCLMRRSAMGWAVETCRTTWAL